MFADTKESERVKFKSIRSKVLPYVHRKIFLEVIKTLEKNKDHLNRNSHVGLYWPIQGEVDIREIKLISKFPIALPASSRNGVITYHKWGIRPLKKDVFGIPSPLDEPALKAEEISILLVPAIAIDVDGYRLGSGGGYFDRLRSYSNWCSIPSLVIIPKACVSNKPLPREQWDIPFDGWITEEGESYRPKNNY